MRLNRSISFFVAGLIVAGSFPVMGRTAGSGTAVPRSKPGLMQLEALPASAAQKLIGIATFKGAPPSASKAAALRKLGLTVQPMKHLPVALLYGTKARLRNAVARGLAADVYPNERLDWLSRESRAAVRADKIPTTFTGKGVGVAILDTGIDATHPDLADHVTHNVKFVGPEYLGLTGLTVDPNMPPGTLVLPIDQLPYSNSDDSGHGTHVAGIVGADGTTSPDQVGMAPDADIIGLSTGDSLFIFTIVAAFDYVLEHRDDWNIDVVNNSWGSTFKLFDPEHPINVATKAIADAGVVVTFAAGNSYDEMQINPWSVAPWNISVGAGTVAAERSSFSSGGMRFDNSLPVPLPESEHLRFDEDRIGIYHPDVSGPGSDIVSSGTPTGTYVNLLSVPPQTPLPGGTAIASGTSMSSPHVAGLAALLLQARPGLTPTQVREVMQVTSTRLRDNTPFWHAGYGWIDAPAAIDLVRRPDFGPALLASLQTKRDAQVQSARKFKVLSSDLWTFTPLGVTALGLDTVTYEVEVPSTTKAFNAAVAYTAVPALGNFLGLFDWQLVVKDAVGATVAESTVSEDTGLSRVFVDLEKPYENIEGNLVDPPKVAFGKWTIDVIGNLWVRDPADTLATRLVSVSFSQLAPRVQNLSGLPQFVKATDLHLYFQPDGSGGPATSPEGCSIQAGAPTGGLAPTKSTAECQAGIMGYGVNFAAGIPAEFVSAPLKAPIVLGGPSVITLYLADAAQPVYDPIPDETSAPHITYALDAIDAAGEETGVSSGTIPSPALSGTSPVRGEYTLIIPPSVVPVGSTLRLRLQISAIYTSTMRMLYGGEYADAGIKTGVGSFTTGKAATGGSKPAPKPKPNPEAKGGKQLPATGVGASATGTFLLLVAAALVLATTRSRRIRSFDS
jgi:serine protease AprX